MNEATSISFIHRIAGFCRKPWKQQKQSLAFRYIRSVPHAILPVKLRTGHWWLAENDFIGAAVLWSGFENDEFEIASALVTPGMTVLDIGAHKGFYTLLFSHRAGSTGKVFSFEPSTRERRRLLRHIGLNKCENVKVFDFALGQSEGEASLFVVDGPQTGLNSLRPPADAVPTHEQKVPVRPLDAVLQENDIRQVDFVKMDVEGAEKTVLSGATRLFTNKPRPVILIEVSDVRTKQWGYAAEELLSALEKLDYSWFRILPGTKLAPADRTLTFYDENFIGIPSEKLASHASFIASAVPAKPAHAQQPSRGAHS